MEKKQKIPALVPLFIILLFSGIIYALRYVDDLNQYNRNLSIALPAFGMLYLFIFFGWLRREKLTLGAAGFKTSRLRLTVSIILGVVIGLFFFMIYFGAHPNRGLPDWPGIIAFNLHFIFLALIDELVFRVWILHSFRTAFSRWRALLLSTITYVLVNLAMIGRDLSSVVAGRIDLFLIIETLGRTFFIGLILAGMYLLTKCIYGNLLFMAVSNVPVFYEIEGPAFQSNLIAAVLAVVGLFLFVGLAILHVPQKLTIPTEPVPEKRVITS